MTPEPEMPPLARPEGGARRSRRAKEAVALGLEPSHLGILALILVMAVALAVFFARPDIFSRGGLRLEDVPSAAPEPGSAGTASLGNLQVAGIRTFYGEDYKPRVRAVVINHGESPQESVHLEVQLRPPDASPNDSALASFVIQLDESLGPHESREIEADLNALGTLASLPRWDRVRIDLQSATPASPPAGN